MAEVERKILFGSEAVVVTDPDHLVPVSGDVIVELRVFDGILYLTLGSHLLDGQGPPEVRVVSRLRIPLGVASTIYTETQRRLELLAEQAEQAKKAAN